jgi:RimJ/RimL family protein N-acetyltransferase
MDIDPPNACVEIGATWYTPTARGTSINPACKLLLLRHAFETLGCVRVTLKCDGRNLHSQRAITKLGATREGTLRKHRIQQNGFVRDTVMFSVIRDEWPTVRAGLEARTH